MRIRLCHLLHSLDVKALLSEVCKAINDVAYSVEVKSLERRDLMSCSAGRYLNKDHVMCGSKTHSNEGQNIRATRSQTLGPGLLDSMSGMPGFRLTLASAVPTATPVRQPISALWSLYPRASLSKSPNLLHAS